MLLSLWRGRRWVIAFGLMSVLALALIAGACGDEEEETDGGNGAITRGPQTPIVIAAGEPIIVGISASLTGPIGNGSFQRRFPDRFDQMELLSWHIFCTINS